MATTWRDEGLLLAVRRHGEGAAILEVLTAEHGRHAGVAPGGGSRRMAPVLQPGAQLSVEWRARLEEHMGSWRVEPARSRAAAIMSDRRSLSAMGAISALLVSFLPEREPHPELYARTLQLVDALGTDADWPALYALWELGLLRELGYGLDLSCCAVTGAAGPNADLAWISPRTGRAVSREAGGPWSDRLLPMPRLFLGDPRHDEADIAAALRATGHFWDAQVAPAFNRRAAPEARARLVALFRP
ncbi:DNA repair protein RecO [uncultured Albimonas sp.]|uniref:DNA repair protein RecO n=1 Tax=uncultured Albimonas sp. TaxID=1331701 RepID=UPI0030EDF3BB|tara:strand:+ start:2853 stop:3587 length:735 start_codon:yes stop_codon:yes gene_type:complete